MNVKRVALVTGAGAGVGRSTAHKLASQGYSLACVGLHESTARKTAAELQDAIGIACDVAVESDVITCVEQVVKRYGRIDVVVNNAGIGSYARAEDETAENFDRVIAVCARGPFLVSKYSMPHLRASRGCIVNVASTVGAVVGVRNRVAYAAAKAAVMGLTRAMAVDHVAEGVRVNAICLGTTETAMVDRLVAQAENAIERRKQFHASVPIGRMATPEEIAATIAYLASEDAAFITGIGMVVDGGHTMQ
ncbi:meso-butanediol dehydrogenase/(S,S)-butanediol dehydrogenase/diacetyl reductase [Bradyrhizobium sp. USDA 4516]